MPDSLLPLPDEPQDLIAFVEARLTEDEGYAIGASRGVSFGGLQTGPRWVARSGSVEDAETGGTVVCDEGMPNSRQARHIARHDPARVLRDVAALRSVVEECKDTMEWSKQLRREGRPDDAYARHVGSLLGVLRAFAAVWSEHPDFRPEWSPNAN
jgi:hypothetical protein